MPNVKKIVGNSREINTKQVIPVDFLQPTPYRSNTQQLLKDIERARFVPTNGKTLTILLLTHPILMNYIILRGA